MPQNVVFEARGLTVGYGRTVVLEDVSFSVGAGVTALLGENGAGKTTLMRAVSGLIRPTGGSILAQGAEVRTRAEWRRFSAGVGYLPQSVPAVRHLTCLQYLRYLGFLKGLDKDLAARDAETVLGSVDLSDKASTRTSKLSGGMRRRLGLAGALMGDPHVLLLDEPTVGLDPMQRTEMRNLISRVASSRCVLLSTHLSEDVAAVASAVVVLHRGGVAFQGGLSEFASGAEGPTAVAGDVERAFAQLVGGSRA